MEFNENEKINQETIPSINQITSLNTEINSNQITYAQTKPASETNQQNAEGSISYTIEENNLNNLNLEQKKIDKEPDSITGNLNKIFKIEKLAYKKDGNTIINESKVNRTFNLSNSNNIIKSNNTIYPSPKQRIRNKQIKRYKPKNILPRINIKKNSKINLNINENTKNNLSSQYLSYNSNNYYNNKIYNYPNNKNDSLDQFKMSQSFISKTIKLRKSEILNNSNYNNRFHSPNPDSIKRKTINRGQEVKNIQITHIICSTKPSDFHITEKLETDNIKTNPIQISQIEREKLKKTGISSFRSSCKETFKPIVKNLKGKTTVYQHARGIGMTNDKKGKINPMFYSSDIKKLEPIIKEKNKEKVEYIENFRSDIAKSNNSTIANCSRINNEYSYNISNNNYNTISTSNRNILNSKRIINYNNRKY